MTEPRAADAAEGSPASEPRLKPSLLTWRVPASFWVWSLLLIASYLYPTLAHRQGAAQHAAKQTGISAQTLTDLTRAEMEMRLSLVPLLSSATQPSTPAKLGKPPRLPADDALSIYRTIAIRDKGAASARKAIILQHRRGTFDESFVSGTLALALAARGAKPGEIESETALWRALYGTPAGDRWGVFDARAVAARVRALKLGILEHQVLADVYTRAGLPADAAREKRVLARSALGDVLRALALNGALIAGGIAGLGFLVLLLVAWRTDSWRIVARVPVAANPADAPRLDGGELLDVFVAYLAIYRAVSLLVGILPGAASLPLIPLVAGTSAGCSALAALYLYRKIVRFGWNPRDLGIAAGGRTLAHIAYGIAGYCAALPVVLAFSTVNSAVFHKSNSTLAPNPVLPLIAGEGSDVGRVILFLLVAVSAPLFEELFFRGVLYSALRTRFGIPAAVCLSALCFASVHPMGDWLPIFGLGCALAAVRELRQSLIPGMVMHFCQNALAFALLATLFSR